VRRGPTAGRRLADALEKALGGFPAEVRVDSSTDWHSVTFSGARHSLRVILDGDGAGLAADRLLARFPEADFPLCGHLLADIGAAADERSEDGKSVELEIRALTVELETVF